MEVFDNIASDVTLDGINIEDIQKFLQNMVSSKDQTYDLALLSKATAGVVFSTAIRNPVAHITTCCAEIFEHLDSIGYK